MTLSVIILIILLGLVLILLEVLVIPGTTIAGFGGLALMGLGIYFAYDTQGILTGNIVLGITLVVTIVSAIFALRSKTWKRITQKAEISSKVNTVEDFDALTDHEGVSVSRLNPAGKIMVNGKIYEARSQTGFIDEGKEVNVIKVENNQLIVKLKL